MFLLVEADDAAADDAPMADDPPAKEEEEPAFLQEKLEEASSEILSLQNGAAEKITALRSHMTPPPQRCTQQLTKQPVSPAPPAPVLQMEAP